jgi:ABC-type transport system involved in multi-copper enzyme maturation permease subunit
MLLAEIQLPAFVSNHLPWWIAAAVIVVGLLVTGLGDLSQLSLRRIWAISGVCFQESIRRRVLWITPLAIIGVIISVQLLQPLDEQDAVRQTIKYALFATGTVVVLATIILACTNLPKEIDNRVIYTVVTKPTTRLEIVLGKIVGFARVSGTLLLIMGVFTLLYAGLRASHLRSNAETRLATLPPNDASRPSLEHYSKYGLLQAKTYARPVDYQEFARVPQPQDRLRWIHGNEEQSVLVGFDLPAEMFDQTPDSSGDTSNGGLVVRGNVAYEYYEGNQDYHPTPFPGDLPDPREFRSFSLKQQSSPIVNVSVTGPDKFDLIPATELLPSGGTVYLTGPRDPDGLRTLTTIVPKSLDRLQQLPPERRRIYIRLTGVGAIRYGIGRDSLYLVSPRLQAMGKDPLIRTLKEVDGRTPQWPIFRGREMIGGQELRAGGDLAKVGTGVFAFRGVPLGDRPMTSADQVALELRVPIEGSGDETAGKESLTTAVIQVHNLKSGKVTDPMEFPIESNRPAFFTVPADAVAGGDFDVQFRCLAPGHYIIIHSVTGSGDRGPSPNTVSPALQFVVGQEPFIWNLAKSLLVMWLMSLLVVIVSIFCSTFVSWPIAVVLTGVILLGHWGAQQIGDSNAPGLGAQIGKDLFGVQDPSRAYVIKEAVDTLSKLLNTVSKWLPDIAQFSAAEDIERGMTMAPRVLKESVKVILMFGVPLAIWSYVFLKRKEVAP